MNKIYNVIYGNYFPREVIKTFFTMKEAEDYVNESGNDMHEIEIVHLDSEEEDVRMIL